MTADSGAEGSPGELPRFEGIVENDDPGFRGISGSKGAARDESIQREVGTFMAQFRSGPDPEIAAIFAETERHAEDNRLSAYRESLAMRDAQAERDQSFRMAKLKHSARERTIVLYGSIIALVVGGAQLSWQSCVGKSDHECCNDSADNARYRKTENLVSSR